MTDKTQTLTFTQQVQVSPSVVYFAFTKNPVLQTWLCDVAEVGARENGRFYAWWNKGWYASGLVTKLEEDKKFSFTWHGLGEPAPTKVDVTLKGKDDGTLVTLKHSDIGTGTAWEETVKDIKEEWPKNLTNLQWAMEKGIDKRVYDRPLLGIYPEGQLDEEQAERLGVPVDKGIWISGTLEGTGAEEAGLQANDVLVKIGDTEIVDFLSFAPAVSPYKAEDVVDVEIYRGKEKLTVPLKLSSRPYPEVPPKAKELAKELKKVHKQLDEEIEAIFEGVSEEEAAKRPAPEEWSAKEVIAHLLYSERWIHIAISTAVDGQRNPGFFNDLGSLVALAGAYPSMAELIAELKRSEVITEKSLAALSDEFVARKISYIGLGDTVLDGFPRHSRTHFTQIREAIKSAKEN